MTAPTRAPSIDAIRRLVAAPRERVDPRARILSNVDGPLSPALREVIDRPGRAASVLIALLDRPRGLTVLFTERAAHLRDHAGQISFPGGRLAERETPVDAALREAYEEIGLRPGDVEVLGALDDLLTGTGFAITPIVGYVGTRTFVAQPDPAEVASVFEVPLEFVLEPANTVATYNERLGTRFLTYELSHGGYRIWGATAAMLVNFRDILIHGKT